MKEKLRDKTRDDLTDTLNSLGIGAAMAERGRPEESIRKPWGKRSLGVIDLAEGPIKWINVVRQDGSQYSPPRCWFVLCIPDERPFSKRREVKIKTVRKKSFPVFGKVVDVAWEGDDYGTGLLRTLANDYTVKSWTKKTGNLEVRRHDEAFDGWTLQVEKRVTPTRQDWDIIRKIVDYLLSSR